MQTRVDEAKKTALYAFRSLAEFGDWIANTPRTRPCYDLAEAHGASATWDLGCGYVEAVNMAQNGWIEGAQRAQETLKAFNPGTPQPDTKVDFYGHRPHVPRFCAGAPDCMVRRDPIDPRAGAGKVLSLAVGLDASAYTDARHMANFGVAVAQYINQLETDGTRVEVIGVLVGVNSARWRQAHTVTIKSADQPLDLAVMAFAIGHPAMLRRIGFAAIERSHVDMGSGYGDPVNASVLDVINAPPGLIVLNGMKDAHTHAPTPQKALEYVSQQIEKAIEAQYA